MSVRTVSLMGSLRRLAFVAALIAVAKPALANERAVVIDHVTVIDTLATDAEAARLPDRTVVIAGGRIVSVSKGAAAAPAGALRIDGRGRFLIPGLWDMHAHVFAYPKAGETYPDFPLDLANGITGLRDMGSEMAGDAAQLAAFRALQRNLETGAVVGPRLLSGPLRVVDHPLKRGSANLGLPVFFVADAAGGERLADYVHDNGIDLIKPYDYLPRRAYLAMMARARLRGVAVGGHVPLSVGVIEAAEAGQKSIDHAVSLPLACSPAGEARRAAFEAAIDAGRPEGLRNPGASRANVDLITRAMDGYDPALCQAAFEAMRKAGTAYVPTHVTRRMDAFAGLREYREDPKLAYIAADSRAGWAADAGRYAALSPADRLAFQRFYAFGLKITADAHRAGVRVLIGTDSGDTYIFPGFSYHLEMESLVDAGLSSLDVLKAATIEAARFEGGDRRFGSVTAGKAADVVLLRADPLADISAAREVETVILNGRVHDRAALQAGLDKARAAAAAR